MSRDVRGDLVLKLKEIFRSDRVDLDFGIYRILKQRRDEINRFIEEDLVRKAEEEFGALAKTDLDATEAELGQLRAEINRDFGEGTINEKGEATRNHEAPKIKQYFEKRETLTDGERVKLQINDVFNHVYEFFNRYYDKGDFISQRRFGGREKYVIPYNGEEVSLHWANQDQYYVKTTEDYYKYTFKIDACTIVFKLITVDVSQNNNVGENAFFQIYREMPIRFIEDQSKIEVFFVHRALVKDDFDFYEISKRSQKTTITNSILEKNYEIIINNLGSIGMVVDPVLKSRKLRENLVQYCRKNDMDYFIHKDLGDFLRRELEFYIKNEVLDMDEWLSHDEKNDAELKSKINAIRGLSEDIIDFLSELEDYQLCLFEKKKLVLRTDYCISLDRIPDEFYGEIGSNSKQVLEWKKIYKLVESAEGTLFSTGNSDTLSVDALKSHKTLVLDTKFFSNAFKYRLLSTIDDLDKFLEGICIKSDNWHALELLKDRYKESIDCIYIDPPYNREGDGFLYKDKFKHSSWLSMMENRVQKSIGFLSKESVTFTSIDDNEHSKLKLLLDSIFNPQNFVINIIWQKKYAPQNDARWLSDNHDFIVCYSKNKEIWRPNLLPRTEDQNKLYKNPDNDPRGPWMSDNYSVKTYTPSCDYPITTPAGRVVNPPASRCWMVSPEKFNDLVKDNRIWFGRSGNGVPRIKRFLSEVKDGITPVSIWSYQEVGHNQDSKKELKHMINEGEIFDTPKPIKLLSRILQIGSNEKSIVLDYFAGSGSLGHATLVRNEEDGGNRKYILIEMGDYFESTLINRLKKAMYSKEWKNGNPVSKEGRSHAFKYLYLEQYDDTLNNIFFTSDDGYAQTSLPTSPGAFINYILKKDTQGSPVLLNIDEFKTPLEYKIQTLQNREEVNANVDLVETFNYLLGIKVKKIRQYRNDGVEYIVVYGDKENPKENTLIIWRNFDESKLETEKFFIEKTVIPELHTDNIQHLNIYINVDSYIKGAQSIEPIFKELMGIRND